MNVEAFVCCSIVDRGLAEDVLAALKAAGIPCVLAPREIRHGDRPVMILLFTRNVASGSEIESEVERAVYRGFPIVVFRLDNVPPSKKLAYYLGSRPFHRIDAFPPPLEQHLGRLVQAVNTLIHPSKAVTARPSPPAPTVAQSQRANSPSAPIVSVDEAQSAHSGPAERDEFVGFFSYSPKDDQLSDGALPSLRARIHNELEIQIGRDFRLWQDKQAIPQGENWERDLRRAIAESDFFIPIVTPFALSSVNCKAEYRSFVAREATLGRHDLIFPLLYVDVPALRDEELRYNDERLRLIGERQWFDWRDFRHLPANSPEVTKKIAQFCRCIADTLLKRLLYSELAD
ncbi:MAG TPA: toll/interleukin-1 receptor domain-containing protein [Xanthobacteraceae bacterium]|jgi:hypothetical protein